MLQKKLQKKLLELNIKECSILLAVSGGADSVAMLHLFMKSEIYKNLKLDISIAHINHGLRDESIDEADFVKSLAKQYGLKFYTKTLTGKKIADSGIEEWARESRYLFFESLKKRNDITYICTAHTEDDQVETLLMRMSRGAGVRGLCGIRAVRKDGVVRPLLSMKKKVLYLFLKTEKLEWYEDLSNRNNRYTRNTIRNKILPEIVEKYPNFHASLLDLSATMQRAELFLSPKIDNWIEYQLLTKISKAGFSLKLPLVEPDGLVAYEAVAEIFRRTGISISSNHIDLFINNSKKSGEFLLANGFSYFPSRDRVDVVNKKTIRKDNNKLELVRLKIGESVNIFNLQITSKKKDSNTFISDRKNRRVILDYGKMGAIFTVRKIKNGDRFSPLGSNKNSDVIKFLKKQGINSFGRKNQLALFSSRDEIAWLPNIAISEKYKIDNTTKESILFEIKVCK